MYVLIYSLVTIMGFRLLIILDINMKILTAALEAVKSVVK